MKLYLTDKQFNCIGAVVTICTKEEVDDESQPANVDEGNADQPANDNGDQAIQGTLRLNSILLNSFLKKFQK